MLATNSATITLDPISLDNLDKPMWIHNSVNIGYSDIPNAGLGIFAKNDIPAGKFLGEYLGVKTDSKYVSSLNPYAFKFDNQYLRYCVSTLVYLNCQGLLDLELW